TLVVYDDVVLSADRATPADVERDPSRVHPTKWLDAPRGELVAFSARTGKKLWSAPCREGFHAPVDVLVADGLVWSGELVVAREPGFTVGRDPHTGEIKRRRPADDTFFQIGMPHHRCHRNRATNRYLVLGRAGVELIDLATGKATANHWVRGTCQFGVLPCNGLIYAPPHACACYIEAKLNGFYALAPRARTPRPRTPAPSGPAGEGLSQGASDAGQLERGPAYARVQKRQPAPPQPGDWPTYRHDAARSGRTSTAVSDQLKQRWKTRLIGNLASRSKPDNQSAHTDTKPTPSELAPALSSLVAADGRVFVASKDDHTVHALDSNDGTILWQAMAGGRVDSPPTVYQGMVLFGSADGSVHCLDAATGELVWRFRGAATERQVVAYGQLESTWPIHGSVLIEDGAVIFAAGRSSYLDGGIYFYRLDPRTGETLSQARLTSRDTATGQQPEVTGMFDLPGLLPDVLSSDGQRIYMRHTALDREGNRADGDHSHLFCPTGFLDSSWWHRSYWIWSTRFYSGYRDWFRAGHEVPAGRPLVLDKTSVYGFARKPEYFYWSTAQEYQLFASSKDPELVESPVKRQRRLPAWGQRQIRYTWSRDIPVQARAMVLAGTTLFVAGPPNLIDEKKANRRRNDPQVQATLSEQAMALANRKGGLLWAVAAEDGSKLAEYRLDFPPVWDGMIAASGHLFCATADGSVVCFGSQ
ncbi:MAG: PQQ-binding-like beta-propeller repeat protein, partial [Pirellulales bacterium]